jgi:hypothetical protein
MTRGRPAKFDPAPAQPSDDFDYSAPAEIFMTHARQARRHATTTTYRRFQSAAEAIRYAIEEIPPPLLVGAVMEVQEERFDHAGIRGLYAQSGYPLARR